MDNPNNGSEYQEALRLAEQKLGYQLATWYYQGVLLGGVITVVILAAAVVLLAILLGDVG